MYMFAFLPDAIPRTLFAEEDHHVSSVGYKHTTAFVGKENQNGIFFTAAHHY